MKRFLDDREIYAENRHRNLGELSFIEVKKSYFGETIVFQCKLLEKKQNELVLLYQNSKPMNFLGIDFPLGSKSYGYFWREKNYNVYHWVNPKNNNETLLFYINIAKETKLLEKSVEWLDLIVDVAAFPDGRVLVLDEDEVPSSMDLADRRLIETTKYEILENLEKIKTSLCERTSIHSHETIT